jgi:HK97 family phage prohead protease
MPIVSREVRMSESYQPTQGMKDEAERAIKWKDEGHDGGTRIGLTRARQIIRGENLSRDTVLRMYSYFERHLVDKQAEGFYPDEKGYPSAGRVAWGLWGGDAGHSWSKKIREQIKRDEEQNKQQSYRSKQTGTKMEQLTRRAELHRNSEYEEHEKEYEHEQQNNIWTFVISTPEIDRYGTVIVPSGIDYSAYMQNPIVLAQHNSDHWPVGRCLGFFMNGENLEATIEIECITEEGRTLNKLIEAGFVKAVSVGIMPKESEEQTIDSEKVVVYPTSELVEFSIVSVPANRGALIKRSVQKTITESLTKYKKEIRMLTPENEQKILEELLPAISEAVAVELETLGFSQAESSEAASLFVEHGAKVLLSKLGGHEAPTEDQVSEPPVAEPPVEVVSEVPEDNEADSELDDETEATVAASFTATETRVGKKIGASTAAQITEGMKMIKDGYKKIQLAVDDRATVAKSWQPEQKRTIEIAKPIQKTTDEILALIQ